MKALTSIVLGLGLGGISVMASVSTFANQEFDLREYQKAKSQVNDELTWVDQHSSCPGLSLALTCGNGSCDSSQGEDEYSCPTDCSQAYVKSYNSQVVCREVKRLFQPESVKEVSEIVKMASQKGLKVRVVGRAHTVNHQLCTDGVVISTEKLNQIIGIEKIEKTESRPRTDDSVQNSAGEEVVTVQPGVLMSQLTDWLHQRGKSLGYAIPGYRGITVAGAIATGSHGNAVRKNADLASLVEAVEWINANCKEV